jgi:DNA polymerase elongation subunit (family B)
LQKDLAKELPPGIDVEIDEQFDAMLSYKAKNYALLTKEGDVIIKGGALKSRGLEKFQRVFLEEMIKMIMQGKPEAIGDLRTHFEKRIRNREWKIDMLMKTDTLQDSLEKYRAKIAAQRVIGPRRTSSRWPVAAITRPGDQLAYYIKTTAEEWSRRTKSARLASDSIPEKSRRKRRLLCGQAR